MCMASGRCPIAAVPSGTYMGDESTVRLWGSKNLPAFSRQVVLILLEMLPVLLGMIIIDETVRSLRVFDRMGLTGERTSQPDPDRMSTRVGPVRQVVYRFKPPLIPLIRRNLKP